MRDRGALELLYEIADCPLVAESHRLPDHPCRAIVASQPTNNPFQLPEPWSGRIDAPILFVGSNPSYCETEDYPTRTEYWTGVRLVSFFNRRFEDGWVKEGVYGRISLGGYSKNATRYWASIRSRAKELLERDPSPAIDYCMTEVVHCKSRGQQGVAAAFERCRERYLRRILEVSGAKVVVAMGDYAAKGIRSTLGLDREGAVIGPISAGTRDIHIAFIPHPAAWAAKRLARCLSANDLARLRAVLREG